MKTIYLKGTSSSTENDANSALLLMVKRPVGVVQGDLLMAHVKTSPGVHITAPRGWDFVSADTLMGDQVSCYSRLAGAAELEKFSWSFTPKDAHVVVEVRAYSGIHHPWYSRVQTMLGINGKAPAAEAEPFEDGQSVVLDEDSVNRTAFARPLMPDLKVKTVHNGNGNGKRVDLPSNGASLSKPD